MGRNSTTGTDSKAEYKPKVDKNPFYRTMDIMNGVFKKKVRLDAGDRNCTDLSTIWVNFNEVRITTIVDNTDPQEGEMYQYKLECGHRWESKNVFPIGKHIPCWPCGTHQSYLGFEHEWTHIIFKSNLAARAIFVDQFVKELKAKSPNVDENELKNFLHLFINAFDDIRVNSLSEKTHPGSAYQLWERWRRLLGERDYNSNFLDFAMAIGMGMDVDSNSPYYALHPILEWGMQKARNRGFGTMLLDIRIVIDRCMGALLTNTPPPPPQQGQGEPDEEDDAQQAGGTQPQQGGGQAPQQSGQDEADEAEGDNSADAGGSSAGQNEPQAPSPSYAPSAAQVSASPQERSDALNSLIKNAKPVDDTESHPTLTLAQAQADKSSQSAIAMAMAAMQADIADPDKVDAIDAAQTADPDPDMAQAIDAIQNSFPQKSSDSKLQDDARAKISFIDVAPRHIEQSSYTELSEGESSAVTRLRAMFFKEMGKKKAQRDIAGGAIDVPAFIQFRIDRKDPDVFENVDVNQGFAFHVLSDMSGSMVGVFPTVGKAMNILKKSLDFPFVQGAFWGFRGAELAAGANYNNVLGAGEVWLYRYDEECKGYYGTAPAVSSAGKKYMLPVKCGGLTPMNSALRVSLKHLQKNVPAGMAKRLYLLTDGSPFHAKLNGTLLSEWLLRKFVAKEVREARAHGIGVYVIIIGEGIKDDHAAEMFGPRKFWKRASARANGENPVAAVLTSLVLDNFTRYLKVR